MAAEDTGDDASIAILHRLRAGDTPHFVHYVDVCSAAPEDLVADLEPAPGTSVWYLYCVKKYKSASGRPGGHRQRAIASSDTCWHSEGGAKDIKGSQGGGTVCNLSYGRKDGRSFSRLGWCMMEYDDTTGGGDYVLCKIYRSPRAQVKPSSAASKASSGSKRKPGGEHPEARPAKLFHDQDTFFTRDYAMPSTVAQVNVGGEQQQHLSTQDGEFVETSYGLLPSAVAQINVEEWISGNEMFGDEEEPSQSSKPEQDGGFVKVAPLVIEGITVEDYLLAPETTSGEASGMPSTFTPPDYLLAPETTCGEASGIPATFTPPDADLFDGLEWDSVFDDVLQDEQTLQMQQPHAAEPDPMAEFASSRLSPRAAAMELAGQHQESHWMMQSFLQAYPFQLPCLMC